MNVTPCPATVFESRTRNYHQCQLSAGHKGEHVTQDFVWTGEDQERTAPKPAEIVCRIETDRMIHSDALTFYKPNALYCSFDASSALNDPDFLGYEFDGIKGRWPFLWAWCDGVSVYADQYAAGPCGWRHADRVVFKARE